jgi:plastocyanin
MTRTLVQFVLVAPAALVAAGCGAASLGAPVTTNQIDLPKSYKFEPGIVEVSKGASVTWTNHDNFTHTVKLEDGDDHKLARGRSVTIRFPKAGTFHYLCTLHPHDMKGEVIVK